MSATKPGPVTATPAIFAPDEVGLPDDLTPPVFDTGQDDLPWSQEDVLFVDDEGNVLPGADELDDDPVDNGPDELPDLTGLTRMAEAGTDDEDPDGNPADRPDQ